MILFQENWKKEVREYLWPFHVSSIGIKEDGEVSVYKIEIVDKQETARDGSWGEFILGNSRLCNLSTPCHRGEEIASITWAVKLNFDSPLHFWAATSLVETAFDSSESWFNYRQNPTLIYPDTNLLIPEFTRRYWPLYWRPAPEATKEKELCHWHICDEWNDQSMLFETGKHFILSGWSTGA